MDYQTLAVTHADRIATITINRPDKLNALDRTTKRELREACVRAREDAEIAVIIITGAGEKAFVAGTDIGELTALNAESGKEYAAEGQRLFDLIESLGKPVVAAVNGYALGGGCELALACHLRIASENARFGQPEVNLGVIPGYGGTQRLAHLIGRGRALEMILTGVQVDAAEALRIGLVNRIFPANELMPRTVSLARLIAGHGQVAVQLGLRAVLASSHLPLAEGCRLEASLFGDCCGTEDFKEGTRAFLEKRKPSFKNR